MMASSNLLEKQKLLMKLLEPSEHLKQEMKLSLQKRRPLLIQEDTQLNAVMSKSEIYLYYDILSLLTFESSWKARASEKRRLKINNDFFDRYRVERSKINVWQIIGRIRQGLAKIKV